MDGAEIATHEASHDALPFRLSDVEVEASVCRCASTHHRHPPRTYLSMEIVAKRLESAIHHRRWLSSTCDFTRCTKRRHIQWRQCKNRWTRRFADCWKYGLLSDDSVRSLLGLVRVHVIPNVPNYANTYDHIDVDLGGFGIAQIYFHTNNKDFPFGFDLSV